MSDKKHRAANAKASTNPRAVTRRTFAAGAAATFGAMLLEPIAKTATEVTYLLPGAKQAYAADLDPTITFPASEACIVIYDPTKTTNIAEQYSDDEVYNDTPNLWKAMRHLDHNDKTLDRKPYNPGVPNATIHITSAISDNVFDLTLRTDAQGCAIIKLSELTQAVTISGLVTERNICANIEIDGGYDGDDDGYDGGRRLAHFPCVPISTGNCLAIPISEAGNNSIGTEYDGAYFREITMDDWNVLTEQQSFLGSDENTIEHTLRFDLISRNECFYRVSLAVTKSNDESRVGKTLCSVGADCRFREQRFTARPSYEPFSKTAEMKLDFFNSSSDYYIYPDEEVSLKLYERFESEEGKVLGTYPVGIKTVLPVAKGEPVEGNVIANFSVNYETTTDPISTDETINAQTNGLVRPAGQTLVFPGSEKWPKGIRNLTLNIWTPSLPAVYKFDPGSGTIIIGADVEIVRWTNSGPSGNWGWNKSQWGIPVADQWKNKWALAQKALSDYSAAKNSPKTMNFNCNSFLVNFVIKFQFLIEMQYQGEDKRYFGDMRVVAGLSFDFDFIAQFTVWAIPLYIEITFAADLSFSVVGSCQSLCDANASANEMMQKFRHYEEDSFIINLHIKATAALAVGLPHIASGGVRAYGGLSFAWQWRFKKLEGKKDPRLITGYDYGVLVFLQVVGFELSTEVCGDKDPYWSDSDKDSVSAASLEASSVALSDGAQASPSLSADDFTIITDAVLSQRSEITIDRPTDVVLLSVEADDDSLDDAFKTNDFTACGAYAGTNEICMAAMTSSDSTEVEDDYAVLLASEESATTYSWPEGHGSEINDRGSGDDSVKGKAKSGGLEPRHMDLVAKDVFSGAQVKLVEVYDACYLFRIACVTENGITRNRVVYQQISDDAISKPFPVEFDDSTSTAGAREELYDFNFDVKLVNKQKDYADIVLMILSSKRASGDSTSIYDAMEATELSTVHLTYRGNGDGSQAPFVTKSCKTWQSKTYEESGKFFAFSDASLLTRSLSHDEQGFNRLSQDGCDHAIGYFIVRASNTKENLLSSNSDEVQFGLGVVHMSFGKTDSIEVATIDMAQTALDITADSLVPHPTDENSVYSTIGYATPNSCGMKALKLTFDIAENPRKLQSVSAIDIIDADPLVKALSPWNAANTLLASVTTEEDAESQECVKFLCLCETPTADEIASIESGGSSPKTFNKSETCISTQKTPLGKLHIDPVHKFCYFASNHTGEGFYDFTEENGFESTSEEPEYVVKAMSMADGVLSKPFTFANCGEHHVDSFYTLEDTDNTNCAYSRIVICDIDEDKSGCASLYHFTMPFLACIGIEDVSPLTVTSYANEDMQFVVALKNYGNTVLTSATVSFYDEEGLANGTPIATQTITFASAESVTNSADVSAFDESDENLYYEDAMSDEAKQSLLVANNGSAALAPGQTKSYLVTVPIPESWNGEKTIIAVALSSETTAIDPGTSQETSPSSSSHIDFYENQHTVSFATTTIEVEATAEVSVDYYGLSNSNGSDSDDKNGTDGSNDGSGSAGNGKTMPNTGDSSVGGLAALALGAAGAGFAAYSARRAKLENGEIDDEEQ